MFLKHTLISFYYLLRTIRRRIIFISQNPSCKFYRNALLSDSNLEGFNVLFDDVQIISSKIGKQSYIQKRSTIVNSEIGKFCSIASNVNIGLGLHKINSVSTHPSFYLNTTPLVKTFVNRDLFVANKKTKIGHDVWIGVGAIILDGINIGTGAIIGAGSVVTKDVDPYSIVGGVPAKHIKFRFEQNEISLLLKSEWWNFTDKWFEENALLMFEKDLFISYLRNEKQD